MRAVLSTLTLSLALASTARAQCAEGRVVGEETAGRCCWPGQRWNDEAARCEGPPTCPLGRVAEGDGCVASAPAPASTAFTSGAPAASYGVGLADAPSPWQTSDPPRLRSSSRPLVQPEYGLMIAGGVTSVVAYLYSIVVGAFLSTQCCVGTFGWMFVPLIGGFIYPATNSSFGSTAHAVGLPGATLQSVGLVLLIVGALVRRRVGGDGEAGTSALRPELVAGPGNAGLGLRWAL